MSFTILFIMSATHPLPALVLQNGTSNPKLTPFRVEYVIGGTNFVEVRTGLYRAHLLMRMDAHNSFQLGDDIPKAR